MIVRTRTPLRIEREPDATARILTHGDVAPTGPSVVLLPGEELRLPGGVPGEELVIVVDLRDMSSSNHARAVLRLSKESVHNEGEAQQLLFPGTRREDDGLVAMGSVDSTHPDSHDRPKPKGLSSC